MKAVRIHSFGGADLLMYEEAPMPVPAAGEVRIKVRAAGVNPFDWKIRMGGFEKMIGHQLPLTLGWDVAGDIESVGAGVTEFTVGDAVYGLADYTVNGAYAEYIVVKASIIAPKPKRLDYLQAASVPMAAETAYLAMYDTGQVKAGQKVLIHGAAGSVGGFAVQLARIRGAHVIGTASGDKADYVKSLGADQVIDYKTEHFETIAKDVDLVLDTLGGKTQELSWQVLKPGGLLVSTVQPPKPPVNAPAGVQGKIIGVQPNADSLRAITAFIDSGQLKTLVQQIIPLSEARQAHELLEAGLSKPGKVILQVLVIALLRRPRFELCEGRVFDERTAPPIVKGQ
jgi:NADPH:quinone reductase-like Zn-dependent oxidoreductase